MKNKHILKEAHESLTARYTTELINEMLGVISAMFLDTFIVMGRFNSKRLIKNYLMVTSTIALLLIGFYKFPIITFFAPLILVGIYALLMLRDFFKMSVLIKICVSELPKYGYFVTLNESVYLVTTIIDFRLNEKSKNNY